MNDSPGDPKWDLLPHDPQGFFGLDDGYERRELKRAYNSLIRRFKPERFPEEFQRIRAAFEQLDGQLRYGRRITRHPDTPQYDWSQAESTPGPGATLESDSPPAAESNRETPGDGRESRDPAARGTHPGAADDLGSPASPQSRRRPRPVAALHERLRTTPPDELYAELKKRRQKSPYEFYALAILSDAVTDDPLIFVQWLLTGLKEHRGEPGLFALLYQVYQTDLPVDVISKLLLATAKVVDGEGFYFVTEKLWDRLLVETPFASFRQTLARCEQNLEDLKFHDRPSHEVLPRLAFLVHLLRAALWIADDEWLDAQFEFLEDHYDEMPPHLEYDIELTFLLRDYRGEQSTKPAGDPVRARIETAIRDYCTRTEQDADNRMVQCQMAIAEDPGEVLQAFPIGLESTGHDEQQLLAPWRWINDDVSQRLQLQGQHHESEDILRRVYKFMRQLDAAESEAYWTIYSIKRLIVFYLPYVIALAAPFLIPGAFSNWALRLACLGGGVGLACGYHFWLKPKSFEPWFDRYTERLMLKKYRRQWRPKLVQFLDATHFEMQEFEQAAIELLQTRHESLVVSTWLAQFLIRDQGLEVYSIALRYIR